MHRVYEGNLSISRECISSRRLAQLMHRPDSALSLPDERHVVMNERKDKENACA